MKHNMLTTAAMILALTSAAYAQTDNAGVNVNANQSSAVRSNATNGSLGAGVGVDANTKASVNADAAHRSDRLRNRNKDHHVTTPSGDNKVGTTNNTLRDSRSSATTRSNVGVGVGVDVGVTGGAGVNQNTQVRP